MEVGNNYHSTPPTAGYQWRKLLELPKRLVCPPRPVIDTPPMSLSNSPKPQFNNASIGQVRKLHQRVKLSDVSLEDLYAGMLLPPISLRDFEDYCCFVEHSSENLYWDMFYRTYSRMYDSSLAGERTQAEINALAQLYSSAIKTFFNHDSSLEINITCDQRQQLYSSMANLKTTPSPSENLFLPPSVFTSIHLETQKSLVDSFNKFLLWSSGNSNYNRSVFALIVGAVTWLLGLVPALVLISLEKPRSWRALGLPLCWLGLFIFIGGMKRTCLIIFFFGYNRQLHPWELSNQEGDKNLGVGDRLAKRRRPAMRTTSISEKTTSLATFMVDLETGYSNPTPSSLETRSSLFDVSPLAFYLKQDAILPPAAASTLKCSPSLLSSRSAPTFGPCTTIFSPLVARAQWETVIAAGLYAFVGSVVTAGILLSVPDAT